MAGRPEKLTPEIQQRLCQAISAGNFYAPACRYAGIAWSTFDRWMDRGQQEKTGKYHDFRKAVELAEAQNEIRLVAQWQAQAPEDWRAIKEMLSRRYSERWGAKQHITQEISGKDGDAIKFDISGLPPEILRAIALGGESGEAQGGGAD